MDFYNIVNFRKDLIFAVRGFLGFVEVEGVKTRCIRNEYNHLVFIETNGYEIEEIKDTEY
jgi:hypothetical protein